MHALTCTLTGMRTCTNTLTHSRTHKHAHTHTHTHAHTRTCTHEHSQTHACMHALTHTRMHARMHARTHAYYLLLFPEIYSMHFSEILVGFLVPHLDLLCINPRNCTDKINCLVGVGISSLPQLDHYGQDFKRLFKRYFF